MRALKYQVTIGKDHRVVLDVPEAEGPAEVIVLVSETAASEKTLDAYFRELSSRPRTVRSKEEIDRELDDERASWD